MIASAVTGGTIVTPGGLVHADLLISGGTIAGMQPGPPGGRGTVDATGCYVLPGGVDPHTHLMAAPGPATAAAARGGTTTALSFTSPRPGERDFDALLRGSAELAGGRLAIDVGLHAAVYNPDHVTANDLAAARAAGAAAVKVFLAYPELGIMCTSERLRELMAMARQVGLVVAVHCENAGQIAALERQAATAPGQRSAAKAFARTRPPEAEEDAVGRALAAAAQTGATCYLVHLSTAGALRHVRIARAEGRPAVHAEVCTHHLFLDDRRYDQPDAGRYLVCPPLRHADHVAELWAGVADGTIGAIGSDHCQTQTPVGGWLAGASQQHAYGLAGIGPRLPLLLSAAMEGKLTLGQVAALAATTPARAFGHYPRKGALLPGFDADIVVFDPDGETVLPADGFGDGTSGSVYAGQVLRGRIRAVLLRGRLIVADGELTGHDTGGEYLPA
ncbi:MAG TPA: amidohydrolase family protein [Streptosporangiaceae bacterium]